MSPDRDADAPDDRTPPGPGVDRDRDRDRDGDRGFDRGRGPGRACSAERDDPVLPDVTSDERAVGWGEDSGGYSDDWYRSERPPHHGD